MFISVVSKLLAAVLVLAVAPAVEARKAKPPAFESAEALQRWINGYRAKPEPQHLPVAVKAMIRLGVLRDVDSAGLYFGFVAGVIGSSPDKADAYIASFFPMAPEDQILVVRAVAWSGLPDWKERLGRLVERMPARRVLIERHLTGKLPGLMDIALDEQAAGIDALWGYYYATGSRPPVSRLISALAWSNDQNNVERLTAGSMAKLTLAINASRDTDLLFLLKSEVLSQGKATARPLAEVIEAAETYETGRIRKQALAAIETLKQKGPSDQRRLSFWGQVGTTALALGCVAASALGQVQVGVPCVIGGAASSAALKFATPGN